MNSRLYSWPQVIATIVLIISGVLGLLISRHPKNKPQYSSGTISESLIPTNSMELQLSPPLLTTKQSVHQFEPTNPSYLTNWNKCINVADGYSIKYPSTFYLPSSEQNDCRTFISDEEDLHFHAAIELFLFDNPKRISFIEWLESPAANNAGILKPSHKGMNIRTKKIGSIEWLTFTGQVTPGFL